MRPLSIALLLATVTGPALAAWPTDPSANLPICTNLYLHEFPTATDDGQGGAVIAWQDLRPGSLSYDIYAQRVSGPGSVMWQTDGVPISEASGEQVLPQAVSDNMGGAIIVWVDNRAGADTDDIYAQRLTSTGTVAWQVNGVPVCVAPDLQGDFDVVPDGAGGAVVVWADRRNGSTHDIYAQRLGADGSIVWMQDGTLVCGASGDQEWPRLANLNSVEVTIVWTDHRGPTSADVYAQRLDLSGSPRWTSDGIAVCDAVGPQYAPTILSVAAPSEGVVISWVDERSEQTGPDIFAQRLGSDGKIEWIANGVAVCVAPDYQSPTAGLALTDGSVILCWPDSRSGLSDLYASRLDPNGNALWGSSGLPISVAPYGSWDPQIVSDGVGGAIVAWTDDRSNPFVPDIYAQRIEPDGDVLWFTNGVVVSNAPFDQLKPQLLSDGLGGAIVAWEDWRDGGLLNQRYKVFAQRIGPDGTLGSPTSVGSGTDPALRHIGVAPNPFARDTNLHVVLGRVSSLRIEVFSVRGELVLSKEAAELPPGSHRIPLRAVGPDGENLPSGVYLCRVSSAEGVLVGKLIVTR